MPMLLSVQKELLPFRTLEVLVSLWQGSEHVDRHA